TTGPGCSPNSGPNASPSCTATWSASMRRDLNLETVLPYPVEAVWEALTDPAALAEWVMPVEGFAPVVGQRFRFRAKPMPGWDGVIDCEVLTVEPPHRLVLRWQGSQMKNPTTVTWTLTATDAGT